MGSIFFCFNWGFTLFDVVDNYVNIYLTLNLGLLETWAAGWVYEAEQIFKKGRNYKISLIVLASCYWAGAFIFPVVSIFSESDYGWIGMPAFWVYMLCVWGLSWYLSGMTWKEWKSNIAFYGVRKLSRSMTRLSKESGDKKSYWWEAVFEYWWGFSIKYWIPFALNFLLFFSLKGDLDTPYGGYHAFWQVMGFITPIIGILIFIISFLYIWGVWPHWR
jgi:SNF family Na+-dependent transporter